MTARPERAKMKADQFIDVFIPVFNDEKYIARAIYSCLNQEHVDVRVLVSDNCSTDNTFRIIQDIAVRDPRVIIHQNKRNIGKTGNMLRFVDLVERPFYMFLCSDDFLLDEQVFASALRLFGQHENLASVYSNIDFLDPNGKLIFTNSFKRDEVFDPDVTMRRSLITTRNRFGIPVLHRSEFGKRHPYIEEADYSADLWHSYKVGKHGTCGHINRSCIGNTYTGNNLTRTLMSEALKELKFVADLEGIQLTRFEKTYQRLNHTKTFCAKYIFFNLVVPIKTRLNAILS